LGFAHHFSRCTKQVDGLKRGHFGGRSCRREQLILMLFQQQGTKCSAVFMLVRLAAGLNDPRTKISHLTLIGMPDLRLAGSDAGDRPQRRQLAGQ
jgi:hypothetical protein